MSEEMPCGFYVRRKRENGFVKSFPHPISYHAMEWLVYKEKAVGIMIKHARNSQEHMIQIQKSDGKSKVIYVDGYCR